jgi:UBX domain-containing protein 1
MANVFGLSSLRNKNESKDDSEDDTRNQYYAGGASDRGGGSGISVLGPRSGESADHVANIIARAQAASTQSGSQAGNGNGNGNGEQPGRGHVITFYREGFTVNDGPYRRREDPENRPFLEAIERG